MHRREIHSHKQMDAARIFCLQEIAVQGGFSTESPLPQVEHQRHLSSFLLHAAHLQIRIKAQKARQAHQKSQVEIGIALRGGIQPLHRVADIVEHRFVLLF